jgi:hypothetical protein
MTWFKIDDSFYDHPKVFDASDSAVALWVRAGCWSARNLTDGAIPGRLAFRLCDDPMKAAAELVERGLWEHVGDDYLFHDWHDYQPARDDVLAKREEAKERMRAHRAKAKQRSSTRSPERSPERSSELHAQFAPPDPTRPDPSPNGEGETSAKADGTLFPAPVKPKKKGRPRRPETSLPGDFAVTAEMRAWAAENTPGVDVDLATKKFINHALSHDRRQRDWVAAWRNWMLNERPSNVVAIRSAGAMDDKHAMLARQRAWAEAEDAKELAR